MDAEELGEGKFSRLYGKLTGLSAAVAEKGRNSEDAARVKEKIVRCLWFDQFLDSGNLWTEDGRKVSVFSPGYWSESAGPDFRNAELAIGDGPRLRGDVEVHVDASDWNRHGHEKDSAYERVILHVVLRNDLGEETVAQGARRLPQLALGRRLSGDLGEIMGSLDPDGYPRAGSGREGACCRSARACGRDARWVGRFLDIAGDERMLRKAERFRGLMREGTPDETLYAAMMETMGYSANRRGFRMLAEAAPLRVLKKIVPEDGDFSERLEAVQGVLFGAAGFLEAGEIDDRESREYFGRLLGRWNDAKGHLGTQRLNSASWSFRKTRPTNHPIRRLAGISGFLAASRGGLCRAMMSAIEKIPIGGRESRRCAETLRCFHAALEEPKQEYWLRRTGFCAPTLPRPTALIGPARTTEMIVNVVIPFLLALSHGERTNAEQRLHNVYCSLRPLSENSLTKYMKMRMFEGAATADEVVGSMRRQQGLLQVFHDYCESDNATCESCGYLTAVEARVE